MIESLETRRLLADTAPPSVLGTSFAYATGDSITVQFSEAVNGAALSTADFLVVGESPVPSIIPSTVSYDSATRTATLSTPSRLSDGNYSLLIAKGAARDTAGHGLAIQYQSSTFFAFTADANHDRGIDILDFNLLATNFGRSGQNIAQGDFDGDGTVTITDFNLLATQFGKHLAASSGSLPRVVKWDAATTTLDFADIPASFKKSGFDTMAYPRVVGAGSTNLLFAQIGADNNGGSIIYRDIGSDGKKTDGAWQLFKGQAQYSTGEWVYKYTNANPININGNIFVSYSSRGRGSYTAGINTNGWLNMAVMSWNGMSLVPVNADGTAALITPLNQALRGDTDPAHADKGNPNGDFRVETAHNWEPRLVKPNASQSDKRLDLYYTNDGIKRITSLDNGTTWSNESTIDANRQMVTPLRLMNGKTVIVSEIPSANTGEGRTFYLNSSGTLLSTRDDTSTLVSREQSPFIAQVATGETIFMAGGGGVQYLLLGDQNGDGFYLDTNTSLAESSGALADWSHPFSTGYWGDLHVLGGDVASNNFIATMGTSTQITIRFGSVVRKT